MVAHAVLVTNYYLSILPIYKLLMLLKSVFWNIWLSILLVYRFGMRINILLDVSSTFTLHARVIWLFLLGFLRSFTWLINVNGFSLSCMVRFYLAWQKGMGRHFMSPITNWTDIKSSNCAVSLICIWFKVRWIQIEYPKMVKTRFVTIY